MPADPQANTVSPAVKDRSAASGDVPEALRRRYYLDGRGGDLAFYVDATVKAPAFRDRGRQLVAVRTDPNAIRDMMAIARHRQWTIVTVRGAADFRREAWLAGRRAGLEVRGYRPTERDQQELERRARAPERPQGKSPSREDGDRQRGATLEDTGVRSRMQIVGAVVRARVADRSSQDRILSAARERLAGWLERGARLEPFRVTPPEVPHKRRQAGRER